MFDFSRLIKHNLVMKSHYWKYKAFNSERQKRQKGVATTGTCGPYYFETPISNLEFKKWLRNTLGINDTSHIDAIVGESEFQNKRAFNTWQNQVNSEINPGKKHGGRPGNLIVKWLSPMGN